MMPTHSPDQIRRLRLRAQRLDAPQAGSVADIVGDVAGIQAQDMSAAALAVRVRGAGLVAADVECAHVDDRSIVRTWAMRGTLHLVTSADLGRLLPLLGPVFVRQTRRRRAELGLDDDTAARGLRAVDCILGEEGRLTRAELVVRLAAHGVDLAGQARPHLIQLAALSGVICHGPMRGAEPTFVRLADWIRLDPPLPAELATAELVRRYLAAYGPAAPPDLAAWSGLPIGQIRPAWQRIAPELIEIEAAGQRLWLPKARAGRLDEAAQSSEEPVVRLLPAFDTYLLGYRGRDLTVDAAHLKRVNAGGGMIRPTLLVDGRVVGTWQTACRRDVVDVRVSPFAPLAPDVIPGLEADVDDVGRFLGRPATARTNAPDCTERTVPSGAANHALTAAVTSDRPANSRPATARRHQATRRRRERRR